MTITAGSILLGLALLIVVGLFVARPFLLAVNERTEVINGRQALEAQKEAMLDQIRDLDFDHDTGKVPAAKYQQVRAHLVAEAANILRQLERLTPGDTTEGSGTADRLSDEIEMAVARLRRQSVRGIEEDVEVAVRNVRRQAAAGNGTQREQQAMAAVQFCPQCGNRRDAGDKFCAHCGHGFA
jgi:hypothetical protein